MKKKQFCDRHLANENEKQMKTILCAELSVNHKHKQVVATRLAFLHSL